jgi:hypothetical protein
VLIAQIPPDPLAHQRHGPLWRRRYQARARWHHHQTASASFELTVTTPGNARVVMTAAKPFNPNSRTAHGMRESGFDIPQD